jgi:hypothetical protein
MGRQRKKKRKRAWRLGALLEAAWSRCNSF